MPVPKPNVYSTKNIGGIPIVQSYLMSIFDGTGSMCCEYDIAVNAYNEVFYTINRREEFQMAYDDVHSLLPYKGAGRGNITKTFQHVLNKLLSNNNQYGKNITIMFISDGQEEFEIQQLRELVEKVKLEFRIQFICVKVGNEFPTTISSELWSELHNIDESKELIHLQIPRPSDCDTLKQLFIQGFKQIRDKYLKFPISALKADKPVYSTATSKPLFEIEIETTFMCYADCVKLNGNVLYPTNNPEDKQHFLLKSVHKVLLNGGEQEDFKIVQQIVDNISEKHSKEYLQNGKIDDIKKIVNEGAKGNLQFKKLTEEVKSIFICGVYDFNVKLVNVFQDVKDKERKRIQSGFIRQLNEKMSQYMQD
ncbi:unnamed protein product [Paramecium pentaurelia]|uniref:VWFA domain-containing protein n=1 Tax=Paramecium pentaurelia TaxID=43138 RepID=A0A8S1XPW7_9CILI|nr:unnamed protein product [Paramecium pentaurelia]